MTKSKKVLLIAYKPNNFNDFQVATFEGNPNSENGQSYNKDFTQLMAKLYHNEKREYEDFYNFIQIPDVRVGILYIFDKQIQNYKSTEYEMDYKSTFTVGTVSNQFMKENPLADARDAIYEKTFRKIVDNIKNSMKIYKMTQSQKMWEEKLPEMYWTIPVNKRGGSARYEKLTVKELQERCRQRKIPYSGKRKAELIASLRKK